MMLPRAFCVLLLLVVGASRFISADEALVQPKQVDPLRLVPQNAIALFHCSQPKLAVDQLLGYVNRLELTRFDEVQELLNSTPYQRFSRYLQYLEKEYDRPWGKLLDDITGNGLVVAVLQPDEPKKQPQVLGAVEAKDAELLHRVYLAALEFIKQEAESAENPAKATTKNYRAVSITSLGDQFCLAQHGSTLLLATTARVMTKAIDQLLDNKADSIHQHHRFVPTERPRSADLLGWGWIDVKYLKDQAKEDIEKFKLPTNDLLPHLLFGGLLDAVIRSDHAWIAIRADAQGPAIELTSPVGRAKSQEGARLLHMHDPEKEPLLPLLNPPGTLASTSFYWNLSSLWQQRDKYYKEGALKEFDEADKQVKPFLAGNSLGSLMNTLGARHRLVIATQRQSGYKSRPKTAYPAFAFVAECTNPDQFSKIIAVPLRTAGFFFSTQVNMKLFDETYHNSKITGYRFAENEKNHGYDQGSLFNYSPSFARVGNFFVISSTVELCKDLIDEIQLPTSASSVGDHADLRQRFSWSALSQAVAAERPLLVSLLTLRHGGAVERVDDQINALLKLLDRLGTLDLTIHHSPGFKLELRANYR
ncbi:MAG TPA: hypothetical protein PLN21_06360 [Gemmatales bacterium]|nr:hypothetical protein [Gemmatales bacterium]